MNEMVNYEPGSSLIGLLYVNNTDEKRRRWAECMPYLQSKDESGRSLYPSRYTQRIQPHQNSEV